MLAINESASQYLDGDKLYHERARAALPLLVRQASHSATVYYSDLAAELGMANERNLNYVLGYVGDAMGHRFATNVAGTQQEFLFDLANRVLAIQNASTHSWNRGEVYAGGMHLATYVAQDTYFVHANWLGTVQARTNSQGAIAQSYTSLPFGDALSQGGTEPDALHRSEHDAETGLNHFLFRQYSPTQGRWMTPDPGGLGVVDPTNPQSWNRYAYVMNNPINLIDLVGLDVCYIIDGDAIPCLDHTLGGWEAEVVAAEIQP